MLCISLRSGLNKAADAASAWIPLPLPLPIPHARLKNIHASSSSLSRQPSLESPMECSAGEQDMHREMANGVLMIHRTDHNILTGQALQSEHHTCTWQSTPSPSQRRVPRGGKFDDSDMPWTVNLIWPTLAPSQIKEQSFLSTQRIETVLKWDPRTRRAELRFYFISLHIHEPIITLSLISPFRSIFTILRDTLYTHPFGKVTRI